MVSLLVGLPAIIAEIEQRVLACVPTAFSTDTWVKADRKQYEAQNDILIDYWRHFDLEITDSDPSNFQGNYAYQNRDIRLDLYTWYSRAGANRVSGTPDVDWQALMMQDAHDLQHALRGPIVTSDGSTGRLIYDNANRSEDDQEATLVVSFRLPVFLRGTAQVPELYLGPDQNPTLNAGETFYLVAQSDLACSAALSSSPAGCTHETALELGSGVPQVIEVTCDTAGTYTFTLTSSSGSSSCTVVLYQATEPDYTINPVDVTDDMRILGSLRRPMLFSRNPGTVELESSDPSIATVESTIELTGKRTWRNGLKYGQYLAREGASTAARENCAFFVEVDNDDIVRCNAYYDGWMSANILIAQNYNASVAQRINWAISILAPWSTTANIQGMIRYVQSQNSGSGLQRSIAGMMNVSTTAGAKTRFIVALDGTNVHVYYRTGTSPDASPTRYLPSGTMGGSEYFQVCFPCKFAKMEGGLPSQAQREAFQSAGTLPSGLAASYQGGHEIVESSPVFWDTSGNNLDLSDVDVPYWPEAAASGDYTDDPIDPVVQFTPFVITPVSNGTVTITARRRRQGVPDRATDEQKYETVRSTVQVAI